MPNFDWKLVIYKCTFPTKAHEPPRFYQRNLFGERLALRVPALCNLCHSFIFDSVMCDENLPVPITIKRKGKLLI